MNASQKLDNLLRKIRGPNWIVAGSHGHVNMGCWGKDVSTPPNPLAKTFRAGYLFLKGLFPNDVAINRFHAGELFHQLISSDHSILEYFSLDGTTPESGYENGYESVFLTTYGILNPHIRFMRKAARFSITVHFGSFEGVRTPSDETKRSCIYIETACSSNFDKLKPYIIAERCNQSFISRCGENVLSYESLARRNDTLEKVVRELVSHIKTLSSLLLVNLSQQGYRITSKNPPLAGETRFDWNDNNKKTINWKSSKCVAIAER